MKGTKAYQLIVQMGISKVRAWFCNIEVFETGNENTIIRDGFHWPVQQRNLFDRMDALTFPVNIDVIHTKLEGALLKPKKLVVAY